MSTEGFTRFALGQIAAAATVALCLVAAACAADTGAVTTPTEESVSAGVESDGGRTFSVMGSLRQIPLSAADIGDSGLQVSMADVDAAADQARVRRPADSFDPDQLADFLKPLTGFSVDQRRLRVVVFFPQVWFSRGVIEVEEFAGEVGFSIGDITTFAALESPPAQFIVAGGVSVNPTLPEVVPGVYTAGEGVDFEIDVEARTMARPLGRPLRLAERDGLVASSLATEPLATWLNDPDGPTLADNQTLARLATRLDEESVVSAALFTDRASSRVGIGLGWAADDEPRGVIVFAYPSETEAEQQLAMITAGFEGESLVHSQPIADLVIVNDIEVSGSEIVAKVSFADDGQPAVIYEMFLQRDGPFAAPE